MTGNFCRDCNCLTTVVLDHSVGDAICAECGLLLESHSIDGRTEWPNFANETNDNDPSRVGGPVNPLLVDAALSTVMAKPKNGGSSDVLPSSVSRWQSRAGKPQRNLLDVLNAIAVMAERLGLVTTIKVARKFLPLFNNDIQKSQCQDRANEIYKKVDDQKPLRARNQDAVVAACLYIACRQENKPRTVKEICSVVSGATKKEIGRAKEFIWKHLEAEMGQEMGTINAADYLNREVKAAQEAVQKSEELVIRRSPISVAAAVIYVITQLSHDKKPIKDISVATGVAEATIKNSYKDLYPHLARIVPNWFADEEDFKNLCVPRNLWG